MGKLFNSPCPEKLKEPLLRIRKAPDAQTRAIGENFANEPNVCPRRAAAWVEDYAGGGLKDHIISYRKFKVAKAEPPDFLNEQYERTFVHGGSLDYSKIAASTVLATCLDVTRLHDVLSKYFGDYPKVVAAETDKLIFDWHEAKFLENREGHAKAVVDALNRQIGDGCALHPVWTTEWNSFRAQARESDPDGWLELLGIRRVPKGERRWLMILLYEVENVEALLVPTAIDAGEHSAFFPALPNAEHGHPMRLRPSTSQLLREYIHPQRRIPISAKVEWINHTSGRSTPLGAEFGGLREQHRSALRAQYLDQADSDRRNWLNQWDQD